MSVLSIVSIMLPLQLPSAEQIRRKAQEVLARPEYQTDSASGDGGRSLMLRILGWLGDAFRWLADSLSFLPDRWRYPAAIGLVILLALLIFRMIIGLRRATQLPSRVRGERKRQPRIQSPEELEKLALAERERGRWVEAIRLLFRACLLRLEKFEKRPLRPGATNRELLRRYRRSSVYEPLRTMVDTIDQKWYGDYPAAEADFEDCQTAHQQLRSLLDKHASGQDDSDAPQSSPASTNSHPAS